MLNASSKRIPADKPHKAVWRTLATAVVKVLLLVFAFRFARVYFKNQSSVDPESMYSPAWSHNESSSIYVYLSEQPIQTRFVSDSLVYRSDNFLYGASFKDEVIVKKIKMPSQGQRLYAHVYLCRNGAHPNPDVAGFNPLDVAYKRLQLLTMGRKSTDKREEELFWYPELKISVVPYHDQMDIYNVPGPFRPHMSIDRGTRKYLPIIYSQEAWQLKRKRQFVSEITSFELKISIDTKSFWVFRLASSFGESLQRAGESSGSFVSDEYEELKELFTETSTWLLLLTLTVSILHSLFDILAFKNDVQFWRAKQDDLQGISCRSIFVNVACQSIILLYLVNQRSSWLIILSAIVGVAIELWKLTKILEWKRWSIRVKQTDRSTDTFDKEAIKYLVLLSCPLIIAYSFYSWSKQVAQFSCYTMFLNTAVGFVYAFGFVLMMPQLYVNYKLKSVAHMPWRTFTYKALNTIVDDLFAFAIRMPWLHRISCFRDDLLFLVYLYQRWIYPVDMKRVNEYGQTFKEIKSE